ncbi:common central domain of tyrosinase-domain-containing protein [Bipolaris maydis]|nr:common central domain of tyrosinase-domain-containing protein [Bipolaris maydis]
MKSFASLIAGSIAFLSFLSSTHAAFNHTDGPSCGAPKPDDSYFSVVGVQGTGVHPRLELRELQQDGELWNMFILAFARFQAMDQTQKTSYYEIAGIHGVPFGQWDKVKGIPGQEKMGYCPHSSNIFGSWHRPYLALFEQILHDRAVDVAKEYPVGQARNKAMKIAARVRLPFWDWARKPLKSDEGVIPATLRVPRLSVTHPDGTVGEIPNPLFRYDFNPLPRKVFAELVEYEFKDWNHTIRYPLNPYFANATSRDDDVNVVIGKQQDSIRNTVYKLLTTYQPYNQVSNRANGGSIGNFESVHDGVHNVFGLGHMGIIEVSAFDPVFWFHHCNVDRLLALFQARYPDTYVEDSKQDRGTFAIARGSVLGPASPLPPFHMNALGDMWTSTTARDWTAFGYTYPELVGNPSNKTLTSTINQLYKPQTPALPISNSTQPGNTTLPAPVGKNATLPAIDWSCEVNMPANIHISYSVRAFLGEPSFNPADWPTDDNYIGQLAAMSSPRSNSALTVTGNIGLSEALMRKHKSGELKDLKKETVESYLKENFSWRIQALDLTEIPRSKPPPGLNVTIRNVAVSIPKSNTQVPISHGNVQYNTDINGNPPVYNGPGPDGTNSTLPDQQMTGQYDAIAGKFVWKNATLVSEIENSDVPKQMPENVLLKPISMPSAAVSSSSPAPSTQTSVATPPAADQPSTPQPSPTPTAPADPQTTVVTSIVIEYVTV